jgi:hypothetical protein
MGLSVFPAPAAASKTMFRTTLMSGTSYTVPANVTYLNVTLVGGGGSGEVFNNGFAGNIGYEGAGGQVVSSTLTTTPGATITYAIGAGGANGAGGTTTFTGATSATGGAGNQTSRLGNATIGANNYGLWDSDGGAGCIYVEYWA